MKKLFTLMAAVLLTFIGSMNANAQEVREIPMDSGWGNFWNCENVSYADGCVIGALTGSYGAFGYGFGGPTDLSQFDKLCVELVDYNRWWGQIIIQTASGDLASTVINMTMNGKTVTIPFDYSKATNVTGIAFQGADLNANDPDPVIKVKRVYLLEAEKDQLAWTNWVSNGDCERDFAEGEVASLTGKSAPDGGAFHTTFEEGKGMNGSRAMVVVSSDNAKDEWDAQFFVSSPAHKMKSGEQYIFRMAAKSDAPANISSQGHRAPGDYQDWQSLGTFDLTPDWKSYESQGTFNGAQDGIWTITFNLNNNKTLGTTFYFDNVEWLTNGAFWEGSASFKDGKPIAVVDKSITASWEVGDIVKVWTDGKKGTFPTMALVDATGDVIAGATFLNENFVKFGITEKMLPLIQANGISVLGQDVTMTKVVKAENKGAVSFAGACWIGDYLLDGEIPFVQVPASEFGGDVDLGYTVDLRFDGDVTLNSLVVSFGADDKSAVKIAYAKEPSRFKVAGKSIKLKVYSDEELAALKANGLSVSGDVTGGRLRAIAVTPTLGTNSFNFINMKIATSNNGNDGDIIPENLDGETALVITDEVDGNGGAGSGAKLTITPNLNVDDYPAEVPAVSRFYLTEEGPQLRLSGGYNGMTIKVESANAFNKLAFYQTNFSISAMPDKGVLDNKTGVWSAGEGVTVNDVTFTLQADTTEVWKDGKLQEVILHDMGLWWIYQIEVDPITDVVIDAADGEDLAALVSTEMAKYSKPTSLTVNLIAGGNYTLGNSVKTSVPFTLNGNGATIDASAVTGNALFKMTAPNVEPNTKNFYELDNFTVKDVTVKGVNSYIYDDTKVPVVFNTFTFDNCLFELTNNNSDIDCPFRFQGGGPVQFTLKNSTLYQTGSKNYKYIVKITSGNFPDKAIPDFAGPYVWQIENNTFYKCLTDKKEFMNGGRVGNNYKKTSITLKNNIFYDCSKGDGFLKNLFGGKSSDKDQADFVSIATGNNTYFADGASAEAHGSKYDKGTILTTDPGFANAAKGDFTLSTASDQFKEKTGDPRWLSGKGAGEATGIEAVKDAQTEGAWYTIQGVRVAQPTKGLYIHNGRKVVIK